MPFYSIFSKLPVTSNTVLCFVYGCNHKSLWESCKFYRFRIWTVNTCTWPCTSRVHGRVHGRYTAVYTGCIGIHGQVHGLYTAVYTVVYTAVCTGRAHGRLRAVYTSIRPCTRPLHSRLHGPIHGRLHGCVHKPCPWPCRAVYTALYGQRTRLLQAHVQTIITAVCTARTRPSMYTFISHSFRMCQFSVSCTLKVNCLPHYLQLRWVGRLVHSKVSCFKIW